MATDSASPPEGFNRVEPSGGDDDESETIELEPGDVLTGTVLQSASGENEHGDWYRLRVKDRERGVVTYFAKGDAKIACRDGRINEGTEVWVQVSEETESFSREDGTKVEYNPTTCYIGGS